MNDAAYCKTLDDDVGTLKSRFVTAAWPTPTEPQLAAPQTPGAVGGVRLIVSPGGVGWQARLSSVDLQHDVLTVLWYAHESDWDVWRAIPSVSGKVDAADLTDEDDNGRRSAFTSILDGTGAHRCVIDGEYRAEFYLNGRLAARQTATFGTTPFDAASFADLNLAVCRPSGWARWAPKSGTDGGMVQGYLDTPGDRGAFLFTFYAPKGDLETIKQKAFERAGNYLIGHNLVPRGQMFREADACAVYPEVRGVNRLQYRSADALLLGRSWVERSGLVHVGIVFRRGDPFRAARVEDLASDDCGIVRSVTTVY